MEPKTTDLVINGENFEVLFSREQILNKVEELAAKIAVDFQDILEKPVLLFVVTGGIYFGVDLSRSLDRIGFLHAVDTIGIGRYGDKEEGGPLRVVNLPHSDLAGRDIIVAEDVVDYGTSMNYLKHYLDNLPVPPNSVRYCALILKKNHGPLNFEIDYLGFAMEPAWIVGNGMDARQACRGLEAIYRKK